MEYNLLQLSSSLSSLASFMSGLASAINCVRATICDQESQYVSKQMQRTQELESKIESLRIDGKNKLESISVVWYTLSVFKAPQELAEQISKNCQECEELEESQTKLAEEIQVVIKLTDEKYHQLFRQNAKDVDELAALMASQVIDLQKAFSYELDCIEDALSIQRKDLMSRNKVEVETLMNTVEARENLVKESLAAKKDEYANSLDATCTQDSEDYNLLKVRLETDVQTLEQHLESMQAAYQLNSEKLDYNYRVLIERDHDNYITAGQQKRKLTKQRDILCTLKNRHSDHEHQFLSQNGKITAEYEKVLKLLQDLQNKEQQLHAAREMQCLKFIFMHQHSLAVLLSKVLQADKIIHEKQLGWQWHPPSDEVFTALGCPVWSNYGHGHERKLERHLDASLISKEKSLQIRDSIMQSDKTSCFDDMTDCLEEPEAACPSLTAQQHVACREKIPLLLRSAVHTSEFADPPFQLQLSVGKGSKVHSKIALLEKHWMSYTQVIDSKMLHVWEAFEVALLKYNQLLKRR